MRVVKKRTYAGIDLGGTSIKVGLLNEAGKVLAWESFPTGVERGPAAIIGEMAERTRELAEKNGISFQNVVRVGVGSPGPLDLETGTVVFTPNLKWTNVPLRDMLAKRLRKKVIVDNDAVSATFGEWWQGAGKPYRDVVGLTLGTGVGGGIVLDGRIHHGFQGIGGHIGHMAIVAGGRPCGCGNRGCLEAYASATAIAARAEEALKGHADSILHPVEKPLTSKKVFEAAQKGDALALRIFDETAWYLATGINNVLNILNPEAVVIGGAVANAGEVLFEPLREHLKEMAFPRVYEETQIQKATLGELAGLIGAAGIARFSTDR